jgi:hypothetical protein
VHYMIKGEPIALERPKADTTSFAPAVAQG